jgi:hypothetical protein
MSGKPVLCPLDRDERFPPQQGSRKDEPPIARTAGVMSVADPLKAGAAFMACSKMLCIQV